MQAWKRRRLGNTCTPEAGSASPSVATIERALPEDLLLEIVARSDTRTFVRFSAAYRLLRQGILHPSFIRRVTQEGGMVPPCFIACLNTHDRKSDPTPPLSLIHPPTLAATSFLDLHLSPFVSRVADELLGEFRPVTSRGGLVLLRRRRCRVKGELSSLCVYDTFNGHRTFLPDPPGIDPTYMAFFDRCVLLTAADGIGCSFLLFSSHLGTLPEGRSGSFIKVQTTTSTCRTWAPVVTSHNSSAHGFFSRYWHAIESGAVVLDGGVIHWLVPRRGQIVSYNVCTTEQGIIKLPDHVIEFEGRLHLSSYYSRDGQKLLRLLGTCKFMISVWHQLPNGDWESEPVQTDTYEKLQSLDHENHPTWPTVVDFERCGSNRSNTVLLHTQIYAPVFWTYLRTVLIVLDLDTKEMSEQHCSTSPSVLLEIDLPSRLRAMKVFS